MIPLYVCILYNYGEICFFQVTAIDRDADLNGNVTYTLEKQDGDKFEVDAGTGHVRLITALSDQDVDQLYSLQIQATDKGTEEQKKGWINSILNSCLVSWMKKGDKML